MLGRASNLRLAATNWISPIRSASKATIRLLCFPYAGGCGTIFHSWQYFSPSIEIWTVNLPGRGERLREAPVATMSHVADAVSAEISEASEKPYIFLGHSMGALMAFEVARRLQEQKYACPLHLFASGCRAPAMPDRKPQWHHLPDGELIERLRDLSGTPEEVLQNQDLLRCAMPSIRADFELIEAYRYQPGSALACGITALGGFDDGWVNHEELAGWQAESTNGFSLKMFPGNHFFIRHAGKTILQTVLQTVMSVQ